MLIENPVATDADGDAPEAAQAFVDFLSRPRRRRSSASTASGPSSTRGRSPQFDYVRARPTCPPIDGDLGGWAEARPEFFDPTTGSWPQIFARPGHPTIDRLQWRPIRCRGRAPSRRYDGRGLLGPGLAALYLGLIVLIPIAALIWRVVR